MTPTREETLQAELEALKASLPNVARKARDEALEEAAELLESLAFKVRNDSRRHCRMDDAESIRALKSKEAK